MKPFERPCCDAPSMASHRSSQAASVLQQSVSTSTSRGMQCSTKSSSSADAALPLNDEALHAGWCSIGQPNDYRGPDDQELNDLAEGQGGRNYRRGVRTQQGRLRKERQRLRRAEEQHSGQQQEEEPSFEEPEGAELPSQSRSELRRTAQQRRRAASKAGPAIPADDADAEEWQAYYRAWLEWDTEVRFGKPPAVPAAGAGDEAWVAYCMADHRWQCGSEPTDEDVRMFRHTHVGWEAEPEEPAPPPRSPTPEPLEPPKEGAYADEWLEFYRVELRRTYGRWPTEEEVDTIYIDHAVASNGVDKADPIRHESHESLEFDQFLTRTRNGKPSSSQMHAYSIVHSGNLNILSRTQVNMNRVRPMAVSQALLMAVSRALLSQRRRLRRRVRWWRDQPIATTRTCTRGTRPSLSWARALSSTILATHMTIGVNMSSWSSTGVMLPHVPAAVLNTGEKAAAAM